MSTVAQKAREEADRVEAEEAAASDAETQADDVGEPARADATGEQASGAGPTLDVQIEAVVERHRKAVVKVIGTDQVYACESCGGLGFTPEPPSQAPPLADATTKKACEACNGYGMVKSGSLHPDFQVVNCDRCNGTGFEQVAAQAPVVSAWTTSNGAPTQPAGIVLPDPARDQWGRDQSHPHYNIPPALVGIPGGIPA